MKLPQWVAFTCKKNVNPFITVRGSYQIGILGVEKYLSYFFYYFFLLYGPRSRDKADALLSSFGLLIKYGNLRGCLPKSGLVDLAWKMAFAHFVCIERLSCIYTKTRSDLLNFWSLKGFSVHPWERFSGPISRLEFYPTLNINLTRTKKAYTKQMPQPVIMSFFNY